MLINFVSIAVPLVLFYFIFLKESMPGISGFLSCIFLLERQKNKGDAEYYAARLTMFAYFLITATILINKILKADLIGLLLGLMIGVCFPVIFHMVTLVNRKEFIK